MPCRADGRTALYDAILATSQEILKASMGAKLLQHLLDDTKTRRFLLVVLTDGADVCSKHTLQDTCGMLAKLQQAKELGLLKILFIGVQLEASAEAAMKRLTSAAGDCASYENVTSVEAIKAKVVCAIPSLVPMLEFLCVRHVPCYDMLRLRSVSRDRIILEGWDIELNSTDEHNDRLGRTDRAPCQDCRPFERPRGHVHWSHRCCPEPGKTCCW